MPHPSSSSVASLNRELKKVSHSLLLSALSALSSVVGPTLSGGLLGSRLLDRNIEQEDFLYDMKITAASMAALGMLSYPYQHTRDYRSLKYIVTGHLFITCGIFITVPIILPLIVNKMSRENDFPELGSLAIGGFLTQLITLLMVLLAFEIGSRNETFVTTMDYLADLILPGEEEEVVLHRHVSHRHHIQESIFDVVMKKSYAMAKQFQETFNSSNARLTIRQIKLAMMRPTLKYLLRAWQAEFHDPYSKYFLTKINQLKQDDVDDLQQMFSTLERKFEATSEFLYNGSKVFTRREASALLYIEGETALNNSLLNMQQMYAATALKAVEVQQSVLQAVAEDKSERDEKKNAIRPNNTPIAQSKINNSKDEKQEVKPKQTKKKKDKPLKLSDLRTRKPPSSALGTPNKSAFFQPSVSSVEPKNLDSCIQLDLTELEIQIFGLLDFLAGENNTYKTYIVGGWAYDRVREIEKGIPPCQYNDIDIVTEIPPHILERLFVASPHIKRLFTGKCFGKQLEIIHEADLSDLLRNAKTRDFMTFYLAKTGKKTGKVYDPTKYELISLHLGLLYTPRQADVMFKEDPLMILRAIYKATKRNLNFEALKSMIITDRMTLFSDLLEVNVEPERKINPHVMNLRISKGFSQNLARVNLEILIDLGIVEAIFPTIFLHMLNPVAIEWIREQIDATAKLPWPKLAMIYATFIAPAIVHQNTTLPYIVNNDEANIRDNLRDPNILQLVTEVGHSSPLFKDAFKNPEELYDYLRKPLSEYCQFCNNKILAHTENLINFPPMIMRM